MIEIMITNVGIDKQSTLLFSKPIWYIFSEKYHPELNKAKLAKIIEKMTPDNANKRTPKNKLKRFIANEIKKEYDKYLVFFIILGPISTISLRIIKHIANVIPPIYFDALKYSSGVKKDIISLENKVITDVNSNINIVIMHNILSSAASDVYKRQEISSSP